MNKENLDVEFYSLEEYVADGPDDGAWEWVDDFSIEEYEELKDRFKDAKNKGYGVRITQTSTNGTKLVLEG